MIIIVSNTIFTASTIYNSLSTEIIKCTLTLVIETKQSFYFIPPNINKKNSINPPRPI